MKLKRKVGGGGVRSWGAFRAPVMTFFWIQCNEQWALGPEGVSEKSKSWTREGFHSIGHDKGIYFKNDAQSNA